MNTFKTRAASLNAFLLLSCSVNAEAAMLQGHVQENNFPTSSPPKPSFALSASNSNHAAARMVEGTWNCVSKVVSSTCATVMPGTVVQSFIQYMKNAQGAMVQNWNQAGWTPASSAVLKFNDTSISTSKESTFVSTGGAVTARTHERLKLVNPQTMVAESIVEQFCNGQFIGTYKTVSVLHKAG